MMFEIYLLDGKKMSVELDSTPEEVLSLIQYKKSTICNSLNDGLITSSIINWGYVVYCRELVSYPISEVQRIEEDSEEKKQEEADKKTKLKDFYNSLFRTTSNNTCNICGDKEYSSKYRSFKENKVICNSCYKKLENKITELDLGVSKNENIPKT